MHATALTHDACPGLISRGGFLKVLGAAALWPWVNPPRLSAAVDDVFSTHVGPAATGFDLQNGGAALFRRQVHTSFFVRSETGERVALRLESVVERPVTAHIEQFSLTFHAPDGATDLHGTRACEHPVLGHLDVFVVPIGAATARPRLYEACFSRFVSVPPSVGR